MWVDIIITERKTINTIKGIKSLKDVKSLANTKFIVIPWLPDEIKYDNGGGKFATYDILDKGDVAVPTGTSLATYSWEGTFPGSYRTDKSMLRGVWMDPSIYHAILTSWQKEGTPLHLLVVGTSINADVLLDEYSGEYVGGFGDFDYSLSFIEDRDITVTTTKSTTKAVKRSETQSSTKSYTIKKGDTLWEIAEKFLGKGTKWKEIYNLNKAIIEATAKKRGMKSSDTGWWIFPGCKIKIRV